MRTCARFPGCDAMWWRGSFGCIVMLSCGRLVVVCLCPVAWKRCRGVVLLGLCGNAALVVGLWCVLPCRPSRLDWPGLLRVPVLAPRTVLGRVGSRVFLEFQVAVMEAAARVQAARNLQRGA